jgi:hypothetical protein
MVKVSYKLLFAGVATIVAAGCSNAGAPNVPQVASGAAHLRGPNAGIARLQFENWRSTIQQLPKPKNACLMASYPKTQWREIPCIKPPNTPLLPEHGVRSATGHMSFAEGGFDHVTGVKSEYVVRRKHHVSNAYSLQLNTQFFRTQSCASLGSPDPQSCFGWEQFAYDTGRPVGLFIEYWLADFGPLGTKCPSGWHKFVFKEQNEVNCWINSAEIPTPAAPITSLEKLRLLGSAAYSSRDQDFAELIVSLSSIYYVAGQNWFPDLDSQWQDTEFNIFGDCCGDQAVFNAGSTIVVRTEVESGATTAPACDSEGFTGESNNLYLTGTPGKWRKTQYPSIIFTETNESSGSQASCAEKGSKAYHSLH